MNHIDTVSTVPQAHPSSIQGAALSDGPCPACECVWTCTRGRTRLACELAASADGQHRLTLLRNSRTYGQYAFGARDAALTFASRLRDTFSGNGWQHG